MKQTSFLSDSRQRGAILILSAIIFGMVALLFFHNPEPERGVAADEQDLSFFITEMDSLRQLEIERRKPKIFPFNPNYLTDYRGYKLGLSPEEMDRLLRFRESGKKYVNSAKEFQNVTKVSDSLLNVISPYFKFPDWVTNPKPKSTYTSKYKPRKTLAQKKPINEATQDDFASYAEMDEELAAKIIRYRERLEGFLVDDQLYEVWDVPRATVRLILNDYAVKNPPVIDKMNINTATASDLNTLPFLSWDLSKEIVDYRTLREGIQSFEELEKLDGMTARKLARIKLYLRIQ